MLLIISDLHLTDGTCSATPAPDAFELFTDRVRELAVAASHRRDGGYRPIERIDLLLLGDVLDLVRSARWLTDDVRPWDDVERPDFVETVSGVVDDVLRTNDAALRRLAALAREGAVAVPPADARGRAAASAENQPVPVRIHYMVGDADWFLHLRGEGFDALRRTVIDRLGLANAASEVFPHEPTESEGLLEVFRRHRVLARHGDLFDPVSFAGDRDQSSLADALAVELIHRFTVEAAAELADGLTPAAASALSGLHDVRPIETVPLWLAGLLQRGCTSPAARGKMTSIWDRLVDRFIALSFVRRQDAWSSGDLVDGLDRALKFGRRSMRGWADELAAWRVNSFGDQQRSLASHALAEADFRNRRARAVVYGHTHLAETTPLESSTADQYVLNQTYFNTGAWRTVHRPTLHAPTGCEFSAAQVMSYLALFQGDERGGRPFETWSGAVAPPPSTALRREHARNDSTSEQRSPAHTGPPAPHFSLPAHVQGVVPTRRRQEARG